VPRRNKVNHAVTDDTPSASAETVIDKGSAMHRSLALESVAWADPSASDSPRAIRPPSPRLTMFARSSPLRYHQKETGTARIIAYENQIRRRRGKQLHQPPRGAL
jgi:hypothetical protein